MKSRLTIFFIIAIAIISGSEFLVLYTSTSPINAGESTLWAFFISLFLFSTSILTLIWYLFKRQLVSKFTPPSLFICLRQAGLLCLILTLTLLFQSLGILTIWDSLPLFIAAILLEFFFQAEKSTANTTL